MTRLGETNDPKRLVPGNPGAVLQVAAKMYVYAGLLTTAGNGLSRIDVADGWTGEAGDAFRERFHGHPRAWLEAGQCFTDAAKALDVYVPTLTWAQGQAGAAIQQWNQGDKHGAHATLDNARSQVHSAAATASTAIAKAREKAPHKPGFWSKVGHFFEDLGDDALKLGEAALNDLASVGNAMLNHPLDDLGLVGGTMLAAVSAAGEGLGGLLDVTGAGAIVGVPLNVVSAAGIGTGLSLMAASAGDLGSHASSDDQVHPADSSTDPPATEPDPQYTEGTPEWQKRIDELSEDPAHGGKVSDKARREAEVGLQLERDGALPGPIKRAPFDEAGKDQGEFLDANGKYWDLKSSPDLQPSYGRNPGQSIPNPQSPEKFINMISRELDKGQNVALDPIGMTPERLSQMRQLVSEHPEWQGRVVWAS